MNLPQRDIVITDAVRHNVPLLFGIFAIWDGGKTLSGIRIGRGMSEVLAGDPDTLHVIDTEGNRALAYADDYKFKHVPLEPPHGSLDYLVAINRCVDAGAKVIQVDTVTHEHYGIGGYLDTIEAESLALAARWKSTPEKVKFSAINVAATRRKELVRHVEQLGKSGVALIFCFRASEKVRMKKKGAAGNGNARFGDDEKIVEMGYMPDTKESLMFLMTASALLMPRAKGVPTWQPEKPGELLMVKRPGYFAGIFKDGETLNEEHGRLMAQWAKGGASRPTLTEKPLTERGAALVEALKGAKTIERLTAVWERGGEARKAMEAEGAGRLLDQVHHAYDERKRELRDQEGEQEKAAERERV